MSEKKSKGKSNRFRNWVCVVYPDSAPNNWIHTLEELCIPIFISPLHDKDISEDNTPKKPHYHVLFMFEGVKSFEQIQEIFDQIGGVYPKEEDQFRRICVVSSIRSKARYLTHMDNPEKAQYSVNDVIALGGADYLGVTTLTIDRYFAIQEMMQFCKENNIIAMTELLDYASQFRFDWFRSLCDNSAFVMKEYIKSLTWYNKNQGGQENDC